MQKIGFSNHSRSNKTESKAPWQNKYSRQATIFGKNTFLPLDLERALNDNTLVIGTSGTGKTYSFLEPNLLQANSNYVIADAKGSILSEIGPSLKQMGYNLQVLNLVNLDHSMTFNPLANLHSDQDVVKFAEQVMTTDVAGRTNTGQKIDVFWKNAAEALFEAIIFFIRDELPEEEQTMATVNRLFKIVTLKPDRIDTAFSILNSKESDYYFDDYTPDSDDNRLIGDYLFDWVRENDPDSTSIRMWDQVRGMAGSPRTWSSVVGILGSDMAAYNLHDVENLLSGNLIQFAKLLEPKNALFVLYDDADSSKNFLSNILYAQLIKFLYHESRKYKHQALPEKVRFFLDDFKNVNIPGFDDILATARSRNISICMLLQDESQLQAKFGPATPSVIGNCSAYLLTGTTDLTMAQIASQRFDLSTTNIRRMARENFLLDVSGYTAMTKRYDYHDHPNYKGGYYDFEKELVTPQQQANNEGLEKILMYLPHEQNRVDDAENLFGNDYGSDDDLFTIIGNSDN